MSKVLIVGCGYVGQVLGARQVAEGKEVWGIRRSGKPLSGGITLLQRDVSRPFELPDHCKFDEVVYLVSASSFTEHAYRHAYLDGVHHTVDALRKKGVHPQRFVFVSSTGVYHQQTGEWVDEDSPTEPEGFSGRVLLDGERLARATGWPVTVVRFGGIYGPGRWSLPEKVKNGEAGLHPNGGRYTNRIHRDDCVGVLRHVLALEEPDECYVAVDCSPAPYNEVVGWLAKQFGVSLAEGAEGGDGVRQLRGHKRCSSQRLRESGYQFLYPTYREGYRACIQDQR